MFIAPQAVPFVSIHAPARGATARRVHADRRRLVSIHAPARGATLVPGLAEAEALVSIHAPARGATGGPGSSAGRGAGFDPRSRTGSDRGCSASARLDRAFRSTLPHGERRPLVVGAQHRCLVSIHAPARGATRRALAWPRMTEFRSTLPHGERLRLERHEHLLGVVSIHAPARGATPSGLRTGPSS